MNRTATSFPEVVSQVTKFGISTPGAGGNHAGTVASNGTTNVLERYVEPVPPDVVGAVGATVAAEAAVAGLVACDSLLPLAPPPQPAAQSTSEAAMIGESAEIVRVARTLRSCRRAPTALSGRDLHLDL
jgi:hypothetical protein